jgi:L-iditol 2-dehydrogenase
VVPQRVVDRNCFQKPDDVSWVEGAFLEPLACVVHSVDLLAAQAGSVVAVVGTGGFGILHALLLRGRGIEVLLFGRNPQRAALANELGLENFDTRAVAMEEVIGQRTAGRGADAVVECTGSAQMWERAPALARRGGRVSFFAGLPSGTNVSFDAARLHYDEVQLVAPFHFTPDDVRTAYELICSHALPLTALISGSYPLERIAQAFERLDRGDAVKLVIEP